MPAILIRDFPKDLHHTARIQAAVEGISLKELFTRAVRDYLKRAGAEMQADQRKEA
jgi:hypothetical protein